MLWFLCLCARKIWLYTRLKNFSRYRDVYTYAICCGRLKYWKNSFLADETSVELFRSNIRTADAIDLFIRERPFLRSSTHCEWDDLYDDYWVLHYGTKA